MHETLWERHDPYVVRLAHIYTALHSRGNSPLAVRFVGAHLAALGSSRRIKGLRKNRGLSQGRLGELKDLEKIQGCQGGSMKKW